MSQEIKAYAHYYKDQKKGIALSFFLSLVQTLSLIPVALLMQRIFDRALPEKNVTLLVASLIGVLLLFCINAGAVLWNRHLTLKMIKSVIHGMRVQLLSKAIHLPKQWYADGDTDALHSKIVHDSERIDWMTSALLVQFFPGVLISIGLSVVLLYQNVFLFLVVVIVIPFLYGAGKLAGRNVKKRVKQFHEDFSNFSKGASFVLKFNELIKISTAEELELQRQETLVRNLQFSSRRMAWLSTAYTMIQSNILMVCGVVVLFVGGLQVIQGITTMGALLAFYVMLNLLNSNAKNAIGTLPLLIEGRESLRVVMPLVALNTMTQQAEVPFTGFSEKIEFKNVSFLYEGSPFAMRNINFTIHKHEVFGIFGASGSGKSTLINLLLGFYRPHQGQVMVDTQPVNTLDLDSYRKQIGVLSQDPLIFPGTIRENLTYGLSDVDDSLLVRICKLCNIHEHISSLEHGYDAAMGDRGVKFSGGQKQRVAIARALLREPEILILDEPDNNLNEAMFVEILTAIRALPITIIIISHNKNLYPHLDTVYEIV